MELFAFTTPEQSDSMLEQVVDLQESMFRDLGLHYKYAGSVSAMRCAPDSDRPPLRNARPHRRRLLDMTADDLGASAYRKFDIEAWMPGRRAYGEVRWPRCDGRLH